MARSGSFSYGASSGSDLTSLIHSLYLQQQSATDSAMFDAWQNGGDYDGQPVTDARILAYTKSRQAEYSKDDPLYDQWGDKLLQTQFSIGEQKATLAYDKGGSAAGMAKFYRSWLGKVPADSAFGRDIADKAAKWAQSADAASHAAAASRANAALTARVNAANAADDSYSSIENTLTAAAQRAGFIAGTQTLEDASGAEMQQLFAMGIVNPATGKPISESDWKSSALHYYNALGTRIATARQQGKSTTDAQKQRDSFLTNTLIRQNAVDPKAAYDAARTKFEQASSACQGEPACNLQAMSAYRSALLGIVSSAEQGSGTKAVDPLFIGALNNEAAILAGGGDPNNPTVSDMEEAKGDTNASSDAQSTAQSYASLVAAQQGLADGSMYYGQQKPGGPLGVYTSPARPDPGLKYTVVKGQDGQPIGAYMAGQAISGGVLVDNTTGKASTLTDPTAIQQGLANGSLSLKGSTTVGYVFTTPTGGQMYGVFGPDGTLRFTTQNPFGNTYSVGGTPTVVAGAANLTTGANGSTIVNPTSFGAGVQTTTLGIDPSLNPIDVKNAVLANPGAFSTAVQLDDGTTETQGQLIVNTIDADQRRQTLVDASANTTSTIGLATQMANQQAVASGTGPPAYTQGMPGPGTGYPTLSQGPNPTVGPYGATPSGAPPSNTVGPYGATTTGGAPPSGREIAGGAYEPPTIKLPTVTLPVATPPVVRQAGVTSQDVVAGPKSPTPPPPALPTPTVTPKTPGLNGPGSATLKPPTPPEQGTKRLPGGTVAL